jgi:hypothetical protein
MALPAVLESAFQIEFLPQFSGCRQRVFGAVYGKHAHAVPEELRVFRPSFIGQFDGAPQNVSEDLPPDLPACFGERAAMDRFSSWPQPASCGLAKELTRFHVHPLVFSTTGDGEDKGDDFRKGKFSVPGEVFSSSLLGWIDRVGNNLQKFFLPVAKLA